MRGMAVALCGRRQDALTASAALLDGRDRHLVIPADVTRAEDRRRLVDEINANWGALDILINNAGVVQGGPHESTSDATIEATFATNVTAPMALARDFFPLLSASGCGRIVNIGSMFGDIAYPSFAAYSASKSALRGFSSALRREYGKRGVAVTYVAPRATQTDAASAFADLIRSSGMRLDSPDVVARRIWREVERGKDSVYPPGVERLYVLIERLYPRLIDRALAN